MRILFISQYFPPEMGAPAGRVWELSKRWVELGHQVTVLTTFPNHPTGVIPPEYRGKKWMQEKVDGIDVVRCYIFAAANKGVIKRSLSYFSFLASSIILGPFLTERPDVVIATSPQFLVTLSGYVLSRLKRRPLIAEIRDIWPDSIVAVGAMPAGHPVIRLLHSIERFIYRKSRAIVVVTDRFAEELARRKVPSEKMTVFTNGVDPGMFKPLADREPVLKKYNLAGRFVCVYIGTIGMAHGLDTVLHAAEMTAGNAPEILYLVVGEGARRAEIEQDARRRGLDNVRFLGQLPRGDIPELLGAADAALVLLRNQPLFETVLPSKMFEAMGTGTPVILGVRGEAKKRLEESGAGICIEPENAEELVEAVLTLKRDENLKRQIGLSARQATVEQYDRRRIAEEYALWLERVIREKH